MCPAVAATTARASSSPPGPVPAFAQPALTTIARADPPVARSVSMATSTGAARTWLVVKVAAAAPGRSEAMITRSGPPDSRMPASPIPTAKPCANVTLTGAARGR
jgi:hypothetical protein